MTNFDRILSGIYTRRKCDFFRSCFRRIKSAYFYLAYLGKKFSPEKSCTYVSCKVSSLVSWSLVNPALSSKLERHSRKKLRCAYKLVTIVISQYQAWSILTNLLRLSCSKRVFPSSFRVRVVWVGLMSVRIGPDPFLFASGEK